MRPRISLVIIIAISTCKVAECQHFVREKVIVLPVVDNSGIGDQQLAYVVESAVLEPLNRNPQFTVRFLEKALIGRAILRMHGDIRTISSDVARELMGTCVLDGRIAFVKIKHTGPIATASVGVVVRVVMPGSGFLITADMEVCEASEAQSEGIPFTAIRQAAALAGTECIRLALAFWMPDVKVIRSVNANARVWINVGKKQGMREGILFAIFRENNDIGRISIITESDTQSECRILEQSADIREGDQVRLVFPGLNRARVSFSSHFPRVSLGIWD